MRDLKIIQVKSEIGAGTRGASLGVEAIKIASLGCNSSFFRKYQSTEVDNVNELLFEGTKHSFAKFIDGVSVMEERVCSEVSRTIGEDDFPFIIAGDHCTAYGTIAGIKMADPKCRLGVIWIDAHADMHSPFTTPSANMHGMPLSMACGIDNLECKINSPSVETLEFWKKIKDIGIVGPKVYPEDIVYIGMRDLEKPENYVISKHHIKFIEIEDINRLGPKKIACTALKMLSHCDKIYISFDVDTLDSRISFGTGTPVANGLTVEEAKILNVELTKSFKVCAWEIVEVNPTLDTENRMAKNAFEILEATAKSILSRDNADELVSGTTFPLGFCRESACRCLGKAKCSKNFARQLVNGC